MKSLVLSAKLGMERLEKSKQRSSFSEIELLQRSEILNVIVDPLFGRCIQKIWSSLLLTRS